MNPSPSASARAETISAWRADGAGVAVARDARSRQCAGEARGGQFQGRVTERAHGVGDCDPFASSGADVAIDEPLDGVSVGCHGRFRRFFTRLCHY